MILKEIEVRNFRSIQKLNLPIEEVNGSKTFSLLGINESGKSSFLQALNLYDNDEINFPMDFFERDKPVEIIFTYKLEKTDIDTFFKTIKDTNKVPDLVINSLKFDEVNIKVSFAPEASDREIRETLNLNSKIFNNYTIGSNGIVSKKNNAEDISLDFNDFLNEHGETHFYSYSHNVTFWKSSPKYLILEDIDLEEFATKPSSVSIPLYNCFKLINLNGASLKKQIALLSNPVEINNLQAKLSDTVSKHIRKVWPEHPIKIKFHIDNKKISFLVEDEGVLYNAKTSNQRSDGFKQFISFLLSLSVQNFKGELSKTILLIDEPETHLHPPAQINLLNELIKITTNDKNNIVFFATHSNYMIDKNNIDRCFKVQKINNELTAFEKIKRKTSTYSEVNFEVFNIVTNDYHNELYGYLEDTERNKLDALKKDKEWFNEKYNKVEKVSLATYIRHSIHHPENKKNKKFTDTELDKSIKALRKLKY